MTSTPAAVRVRRRVAAAVAVLLVATTALLIVGVLWERHTESGVEHSSVAASGEQREGHHDDCAEGATPGGGVPARGGVEAAERVSGISAESPWILALGAIASITLAVAVWRHPNRPVVAVVVVFTAAALVLDVVEVSHQLGAGRIGLATLAGVIAAVRCATILGGGYLYHSRATTA
ncbi:MAG: hypothetical protein ABS80_17105 [Pseudonocardia sp. SCN 72-51]|nr:MAG: hypothetical protein ABS80_17105 [Pseudonocardia sp. SCN 72-51]